MSTMFTYTMEMPYDEPEDNTKNFYRFPRSILLPPYIANNEYFIEFTNQIDKAFDSTIEQPTYALANIRNMWTCSKGTRATVNSSQMIDFTNWGGPDHGTVAAQVTTLGLQLSTAEAINDLSYRALAKYLGQYWYSKGQYSAIDFMNFCLSTNFTLVTLWTQDYKRFVPENLIPSDGVKLTSSAYITASGSAASAYFAVPRHSTVGKWGIAPSLGVGSELNLLSSPALNGGILPGGTLENPLGVWYPTTHVSILVPYPAVMRTDTIGLFFYEIANYNLVLQDVHEELDLPVNLYANVAQLHQQVVSIESGTYKVNPHSVVGGHVGQPLIQSIIILTA